MSKLIKIFTLLFILIGCSNKITKDDFVFSYNFSTKFDHMNDGSIINIRTQAKLQNKSGVKLENPIIQLYLISKSDQNIQILIYEEQLFELSGNQLIQIDTDMSNVLKENNIEYENIKNLEYYVDYNIVDLFK